VKHEYPSKFIFLVIEAKQLMIKKNIIFLTGHHEFGILVIKTQTGNDDAMM